MKFSLNKNVILKPLSLLSSVVEKKQTIAILSNILIKAEENKLYLTGSDSEIQVDVELNDCRIEQTGITTVSANRIFYICKSFPSDTIINFDLKDSDFLIFSGNSKFIMHPLEADNYPEIDVQENEIEFNINQKIVFDLVTKTVNCMGIHDVRFYLNGLLFEVNYDELNVVATDGLRLAFDKAQLEQNVNGVFQAIVPRKTVLELHKMLLDGDENISIAMGKRQISFSYQNYNMVSKIIDAKYPQYERVIPESLNKKALFDKEKIKDALIRTLAIASDKVNIVKLILSSGNALIRLSNMEQERSTENIEISYSGKDITINFNLEYLLNAISNIDGDKVIMEFNSSESGCLLKGENRDYPIYIIMPIRT